MGGHSDTGALGPRARAVLELLYRHRALSAPEIHRELPEIPSYSAVRSVLRALARKGLVQFRAEGLRYVYRPTVAKAKSSRTALRRLLDTYFGGAPEPALKALLDLTRDRNQDIDYEALERLIDDARREKR